MSKTDPVYREYIESLKRAEPFTGFREQASDGTAVKIKILGRGEVAFYQRGERGLLLEVLAGRGVLFAKSIRRWDTGEKVTDAERAQIVEDVSRVLKKLGATEVEVVWT
jgi:hypothetical protein